MKKDIEFESKIRRICTYSTDDGTSGYDLSEEQFQRILDLFDSQKAEDYTKGFNDGYLKGLERVPEGYKKGFIEGSLKASKGK